MRTLTLNQADRYRCNEREFIFLGCTPVDENCTPAGYDNLDNGIMECKALINQLRRIYGQEPEGCEFFILENHHEFGIYHEAAIYFNTIAEPTQEDIESMNEAWNKWWNAEQDETESQLYALKCEQLPEKWDAEALKELREQNYFISKPKAAKVVSMNGNELSKANIKL